MAEPAREEPKNLRFATGVLTIVSGVLVLLPAVALGLAAGRDTELEG